MNILLICDTAIIEHIFTLVCKRINVNLTVQKTNIVNEKYDIIIVDQSHIDDKFNVFKQHTKKLGAISSEELSFDKSRDFIVPRPFLPTKLESLILEQMRMIQEDEEYEKNRKVENVVPKFDSYDDEDDDFIVPVVDYVKSIDEQPILEDENEEFNLDEEDESIISLSKLKSGGVLDSSELTKINDILREDTIQNEINFEKNDWKDINAIIDDALAEVKEYEFDLQQAPTIKPYNLILSNFNINELRPLLEKFDQSVIDRLSSGETVDVKISLKDK